MKTKSFVFLVSGLILSISTAAYLYFYLGDRVRIDGFVPSIVKENKKPTELEIQKAIVEIKNPEPITEKMKTDIEKALLEIKNTNGTSTKNTSSQTEVEKSIIADKVRDQNREAVAKALKEIQN